MKAELLPTAEQQEGYGCSDAQDDAILDQLYKDCIQTFANWFEQLSSKFPAERILVSAGRSAAATQNSEHLPEGFETEAVRQQEALAIMAATGRILHEHVPMHSWVAAIAHNSIGGHTFSRPSAVSQATARLKHDMASTCKQCSMPILDLSECVGCFRCSCAS